MSALKAAHVTGWKMSHHHSSLISCTQSENLEETCSSLYAMHMLETSFRAQFISLQKVFFYIYHAQRTSHRFHPSFSRNYVISDILDTSYLSFLVRNFLYKIKFLTYVMFCICQEIWTKYYVRLTVRSGVRYCISQQ